LLQVAVHDPLVMGRRQTASHRFGHLSLFFPQAMVERRHRLFLLKPPEPFRIVGKGRQENLDG